MHQARLAMLQRGDETTWARVTAPGTPYVVGLTVRLPLEHRLETAAPTERLQPCVFEAAALHIRVHGGIASGRALSLTISHHLPLFRAALPRARARWRVTCARRGVPPALTATSSRTR